MGGKGSGRRGGKATVEGANCEVLDIGFLIRRGLRRGFHGTVTFERPGSQFWADISVDMRSRKRPAIRLKHPPNIPRRRAGPEYRVLLIATQPHYGGERWWFQCPRTKERVGKLYLPSGKDKFLGRRAHDLGYRSQRVTKLERLRLKIERISARLGTEPGEIPKRPTGMHEKTFRKLVLQLRNASRSYWLEHAKRLRQL
jgi:hypothetical protein